MISVSALASPALAQTANDATDADGTPWVNEIVVTAQKREQRLLDVPQSISVVSGSALDARQATSFVDYAALVPGLSLQQSNAGQTRVVLRGINTGGDSPTVAIYVDDAPFGSSTGQTNGAGLAGDFDPFDVARVEVLRGPQGTLYGANSLGGVIKYVTNPPALGKFALRGEAGVEGVSGGGTGWSGNGVANVPLGDDIAVRASGFYHRSAGFIDSIGIPARNVNTADSYGGRVSLLYKPLDTFSVRLTAVLQNIRAHSRDTFDADPTTLAPITADPITGAPVSGLNRYQSFPDRNSVDYRLYTGSINWSLGFADLTSVTSYSQLRQRENIDVGSTDVGGITLGDLVTSFVYGSAVPLGVTEPSRIAMKKFTQELRLASPKSDSIEWLVGAYYTREPGRILQNYIPFTLSTGVPLNPAVNFGGTNYTQLVEARLNSVYREYAGFGSVTWHITPRLDLTGGGRYSHNTQTTQQILDGALAGGFSELDGKSSEGVFTWSVSPRLELSDHVAVYARVAKGYRPGGPNVVPPGAGPNYPTSFKADTLISYEAGIRGETRDKSFSIDASGYYLDWRNIQILTTFVTNVGPITADANGKGARSYGAELTATLRPIRGFSVVASTAYNNAKLTADTGSGGFDGDQLPYAPKWTANVSADYEWAMSDNVTAFVGGDIRLVSGQSADFDSGYRAAFGHRLVLDGYETVGLRAGAHFDRFDLSVYAKNINNSHGLTNAGPYGTRPAGAIEVAVIRPRTIGATFGFKL
jgi:outer membrane receptor protein involved in Fe transport